MGSIIIALAKRKLAAAFGSGPLMIVLAVTGAYGLGWYVGKNGEAVRNAIAAQARRVLIVRADLSRTNDALSRERKDAAALESQRTELEKKVATYERELLDAGACRLGVDGRRRLLDISK